MNKKRRILITTVILSLITIYISCSESLPTYVEPEVNFEYRLQMHGGIIPYLLNDPDGTRFHFGFRHSYEETVTEEYYRKGILNICLSENPDVKKQITFFEYNQKRHTYMDPGWWYEYICKWDQTFDDGSILYQHLSAPPTMSIGASIKIKVSGEFQMSKRYNKVELDEVEFTIYYYFPS